MTSSIRELLRFQPGTSIGDIDPGGQPDHTDDKLSVQAYQVAPGRCSTEVAPWHVVPSDRTWYRARLENE